MRVQRGATLVIPHPCGAAFVRSPAWQCVNLKVIELPQLAVGQEYLLLITTPSRVGLSTVVGLSQGVFRLYDESDTQLAVNALNNRGLAAGMKGPVPYNDLVGRIRSSLRKGERK